MFTEMRRKDRLITEKEAEEILNKSKYGILCTTEVDGYPYGVPVSYIYDNHAIYIHGAASVGKKNKAIEQSAKVCFTVVGDTEILPENFSTKYESVIIFGEANRLEREEKIEALKGMVSKYSSDFMEKGTEYAKTAVDKTDVYKITINQLTGKAKK